jgi:non-haem Fe2+, alpha-ketoglutarate-dependent halogenase
MRRQLVPTATQRLAAVRQCRKLVHWVFVNKPGHNLGIAEHTHAVILAPMTHLCIAILRNFVYKNAQFPARPSGSGSLIMIAKNAIRNVGHLEWSRPEAAAKELVAMSTVLTEEQKTFYRNNGYLLGLPPIYSPEEMKEINGELPQLLALLHPGETAKDIREWHETSTYLYDIVMNPRIHDLVEDILGLNFFCWASSFFIKEPFTQSTVGWHQDAYYWPMHPQNSVTVWLAFDDVDEENGAMKIIPGSHLHGVIQHKRSQQTSSILTLELETGTFSDADAVDLKLKAGDVSLHDDRAVHGSPANPSSRRRAGLTIRYSGTNVKNDLAVNPNFKIYMCRGVDEFRHNPVGTPPTQRIARPSFKAVSVEESVTTM